MAQENALNGTDGKQLEAQVSALPLGKTGASAEVTYFCASGKLSQAQDAIAAGLSVAEYTDKSRKYQQALLACHESLVALYQSVDGKDKDKDKRGANLQRHEDQVKKLRKAVGSASTLSIMLVKPLPGIRIGQLGAPQTVYLQDYITLGEVKSEYLTTAIMGKKLDFHIDGCGSLAEGSEGNQVAATASKSDLTTNADSAAKPQDKPATDSAQKDSSSRFEARLAALETVESHYPLKCSLDKTGKLKLSPKPGAHGKDTLRITASYSENGEAVVERNFDLPIEVARGESGDGRRGLACMDWDCQNDYAFLLGMEGANMSEVKSESILRYEFYSYTQISHNYFHMFGRVFQTSVGETVPNASAPANFNCASATEVDRKANCDSELTEAISADIGSNFFFIKSDSQAGNKLDAWSFDEKADSSSLLVGLTAQYGIQRVDNDDDDFSGMAFGGLRFAFSKLRYFDILYGKRDGLRGNRLRFKGQLPVYRDNFIVGMETDLAADSELRDAGYSDEDQVKFYVLYQVDFSNFIK